MNDNQEQIIQQCHVVRRLARILAETCIDLSRNGRDVPEDIGPMTNQVMKLLADMLATVGITLTEPESEDDVEDKWIASVMQKGQTMFPLETLATD